jgi:hypothetical protein
VVGRELVEASAAGRFRGIVAVEAVPLDDRPVGFLDVRVLPKDRTDADRGTDA